MNYKHWVLRFNILFFLLLLGSSFFFYLKPNFLAKSFKPLEIISNINRPIFNKNGDSALVKKMPVAGPNSADKKNITKDFTTYKGIINTSGLPIALSVFYKRLYELQHKKIKKIRIAYFGDSMIEGDLLTQDLRSLFQNNFGGSGVGFVPITSVVAGFRQSVGHSFSSDWEDINFKSDNKQSGKLFLSGHSFLSSGNSTATYKTVNYPHLNIFENASLLYGQPIAPQAHAGKVFINEKAYDLPTNNFINFIEINHINVNELKLKAEEKNIPFYGVAFESDSGIIVDNFSFRGISGTEWNYFTQSFIQASQNARPYDLIILHYGTNLLFKPQITEFAWFTKLMLPVLQKIKNSFSNTSILMISTADKGANYNGEWRTAIGVEPLVHTQYNMAYASGVDFFNLYQAMGGEGTIVKWAQADTTLANKDYTHPNARGAKILGEIIYQALMDEFKNFEAHEVEKK